MDIERPPESFLDDLRSGERDAFVHLYELYRLPIYDLVRRLGHGSRDAVAIVREVFVAAYSQILLHNGPIDLRLLIYKVAVETCHDHGLVTGGRGQRARLAVLRRPEERGQDELGARFESALATLDERQYTALLLNDVHRLRHDEMAAVLGLSAEATLALLFRAGEEFRRSFEELSGGRLDGSCRLAEAAAASAVGGGTLQDDEMRRLREHAGYCRRCRTTMAAWGSAPVGLALLLRQASLPQVLQAAPVFGIFGPASAGGAFVRGAKVPAKASAAAASGLTLLRVAGRALASKTAAYIAAAVCLGGFVGMAVYVNGLGRAPVRQSASPAAGAAARPTRPVVRTPVSHSRPGAVSSRQVGHVQTASAPVFAGATSALEVGTPALARVTVPSTAEGQADAGRVADGASAAGGGAKSDGAGRKGPTSTSISDHQREHGSDAAVLDPGSWRGIGWGFGAHHGRRSSTRQGDGRSTPRSKNVTAWRAAPVERDGRPDDSARSHGRQKAHKSSKAHKFSQAHTHYRAGHDKARKDGRR